ncbi:MAG: sugar-binding protein [Planctomycetota bacterium]
MPSHRLISLSLRPARRRVGLLAVLVGLATVLAGATRLGAADQTRWTEPPPDRPLLHRPVLKELVVADYTQELAGAGVKAEGSEAKVAAANGVLTATWAARSNNVQVVLFAGKPVDVSDYDYLRFEVTNPTADRIGALLEFGDAKPYTVALPVDPGSYTVLLPLWKVMGEKALSAKHLTDLSQVRIRVERQASEAQLTISSLKVQKLFSDLSKIHCYDFGDGDYFLGATPVRAGEIGIEQKLGYTLVGQNFAAHNWHDMYALLGDGIEAQDMNFTLPTGDGDFEGQVVAYGTSWQGARDHSYQVLANGTPVVDVKIDKDNFYTFEHQYFGDNIFYDPTKSLFEQYHLPYFAPAAYSVTAKDGAVSFQFPHCAVYALWIWPKAMAAEGNAFVQGCLGEEAYALWLKHARMRDHAPNPNPAPVADADTARGYTVFTRYYQDRVYPNYAPSAGDLVTPAGLSAKCAPGEYEPITFTVRPLKDLGTTKISVTAPLLGDAKTSPIACDLFFVKYFPQHVGGVWYEPIPTLLYPYQDRMLTTGFNRQYWITLHVPPGTPAGEYKGSIAIEPAHGNRTEVPFTVTVYPFDLPKTTTECGMWDNQAYQSHQLTAFPDNTAYTEKVLKAECRDMAEHGLNGYAFGEPAATAFDSKTDTVTLDFSRYDQILAACKAAGMEGRHMLGIQGFATYGLMRHGFKELSPDFDKAYINALTQVENWIQKNEVKAVMQITDEPRETDLNEWNRDEHDTVEYCRLAREVPGLQTMVTLMGDKGSFGRPYSPILGLLDVMATHSWPGSDDIIYLCTERHLCDFWAYNNGFSRFVHGFYLWKCKAKGHWQWVYSWEVCDSQIPVFYANDTSAAYAYPGGFLDTVKYEDVREGIDDHRYIELLLSELQTAGADNPAKAPAEAFLKTLNAFLPLYPEDIGQTTGAEAGGVYSEAKQNEYFPLWRAQLAEFIMALKDKRAPVQNAAAYAMFPKAETAEDREVQCLMIDPADAPKIDGVGDDACWAKARPVSNFILLSDQRLATAQTEVRTVCDGQKMYFLFTCHEPKYGELKAYAINRDEDTWQDDSVEIFLDTNLDRKTYKHISVNCLGTIQDADGQDVLWNADIQTGVKKTKGKWTVEIAISVKDLGGTTPAPGVKWGVNLCRNRQPQPQETSSWAFVGTGFHHPEKFGTMAFTK